METGRLHAATHAQKARARGRRRGPAWGKIIALALVAAALSAAWRYTPLSEYLTHERIAGRARDARETRWTPIAIVLAYTPAAFLHGLRFAASDSKDEAKASCA